jgi:hypothetical protein
MMQPAVLVRLTLILLFIVGCEPDKIAGPVPSETPAVSPSPTQSVVSKPFNGTIHGWRIGPTDALQKDGSLRDLDLDCEPRQVPASTKTDLDMYLTDFPIETKAAEPPDTVKWVCDGVGLSVLLYYGLTITPYETIGDSGTLRVERIVTAGRAYPITASKGQVKACAVGDQPAVCVRWNEDEGDGAILVIQDDELDPFAVAMLVRGYGVPFAELMKTALGIRSAGQKQAGTVGAGIKNDAYTKALVRFLDARLRREDFQELICCAATSREKSKWYGYAGYDMVGYRVIERHAGNQPTTGGNPYFVVEIIYEQGAQQDWNGTIPVLQEFIVVGPEDGAGSALKIVRWADEGTS